MININEDYWWVGLIIIFISFLLVMVFYLYKNKKRIKTEEGICEHNWKAIGYTMVEDKIRVIKVCDKCGVAIHTPVYTIRQLKQLEG